MMPVIAVFGSSAAAQDSDLIEEAYRLGLGLGRRGFAVINGGYTGVMEAVSRGVHETGGRVVGVTCKVFARRTPNPYLSEEIASDSLLERIASLMESADGYVVLGGGIGTLAELFVAWNLIVTGWRKPLVVVGDELRLALRGLCEYTEIGERHLGRLAFVGTAAEAVERLEKMPT